MKLGLGTGVALFGMAVSAFLFWAVAEPPPPVNSDVGDWGPNGVGPFLSE